MSITSRIGVVIDRDLTFDEYVSSVCKKAGRKLSVLSRLSNLMSFQQRRLLLKSFVEAQFGYCPLVWMFHGREINRKINHIHERSLRIVYRDYNSSFKDLLKKDNSVCIHHRNIQFGRWTIQSERKPFQYNNEWYFSYQSTK